MQKPNFKRTPLASAIALALGVTAASPAMAQSAEDGPVEEIIVTGIRSSLMRSMDVKRQADGVVDAINAEDIGDFPDTNLAESLQRITGVSIERERGEGNRVTVRGFGPQFNLVLLNGRQMPTSGGIFGNPQGNDRSFDFSNIASEAISAVEVYKSGIATVPSGGIGATINVKTTRPLEDPGLKMSFAAAGMYDESVTKRENTDWTGEVSGIVSNTFLDDTVGVALTVVRSKRQHGAATANVGGWRSFDGANHNSWGAAEGACDNADAPANVAAYVGQEQWGGLPMPCFAWEGPSQQTNRPEPGEVYSVPQQIGYNLSDYERTRTNGQLTLQFRPVETVTATLDYTYTEKEESRTYNDMSAWFNFAAQRTVWPDGDNVTPIEYTEFLGGSDYSMGAGQDAYKNENNSVGLNLFWDVSDRLSLELDYHDSSAKTGPDSKWGNSALLSTAAYTRDRTSGYFGQELPILELGLSAPLDPDQMAITGSVFRNDPSRMDIEQLRAGGSLFVDGGFVQSIDFGVELNAIENRTRSAVVQRDAWSAQTAPGAISDLMTPASTRGSFDEVPGSGDPRLQTDFFTWDMGDMIERAEQLIAAGEMPLFNPGNLDFGTCGTALCPSNDFTTDKLTKEDTQAAYFQVNMATEWSNRPVNMRLGLRYENTDVDSTVYFPSYTGMAWVSGNELAATNNGEQAFEAAQSGYDYWLPNFDFRINITDDLVTRFSASKTLTRPTFEQIQGGLVLASPYRGDGGTGYRGDPSLRPLESNNLDLSLEYYYSDTSYVSAGYFRKDVKNFVGTSVSAETPFDLPNPTAGTLAAEARAAGQTEFPQIYNWILTNRPDAEGVDAERGIITGVEGRDPAAVYQVEVPANIDDVLVDGWELNVQHAFGETGFGFILNATLVDADKGWDDKNRASQFAVFGLSDSANFIPYWENEDWSIRVAYNWRDAFLAGGGQNNVGAGPPTYVDEYAQWDLSASYWATDRLQVYADALNLTNETTYVYGRQKDQILYASQFGTRYTLGVRYKF